MGVQCYDFTRATLTKWLAWNLILERFQLCSIDSKMFKVSKFEFRKFLEISLSMNNLPCSEKCLFPVQRNDVYNRDHKQL